MTRFFHKSLALGLALLFAVLLPARAGMAAPLASTDEVFGSATGSIEAEGDMLPTGNGRFTIDDRVYVGKSIGRSVAGIPEECFTGELRSVEEWSLEAPRMVGTHESAVTIRSERGSLSLRLRGQMEEFTASGAWEIVRSSGACSELDGEGTYTASYGSVRSAGPSLRMTFDGETQS